MKRGGGAYQGLADGQPNDRNQPDRRNGPGNARNTDEQTGSQRGNQPGIPKVNRPNNPPANPSSEPEKPDELRLPEVPALPAYSNPTPVLPVLSWDPDAPFGVRSGEVITKPVMDMDYFSPGKLPSDNMLAIRLRGTDFAPGQTAHPVHVEIMNSAGRLLVDSPWRGDEGTKASADPVFLLPYPEDDWFVVRLTKASRVGIATFGTTPFTLFADYPGNIRTYVSPGRRFCIELHIDIQDHRRARDTVRVLDREGAPLAGAVLSCGHSVLGQSDERGMIRFSPPVPGELQQYMYDAWQRSILRVSCPGKVPAFIKASDLKPGETLTVTLPADEIVISFYLLHAGFEDPQRWEGHTGYGEQSRFGVLPYWRTGAGEGGMDLLRQREWRLSGWWQSGELMEGVRSGGDAAIPGRYSYWYARKWSYEPGTGMWTIVVPHPGVFVYALKLERQSFTDMQGKPAQADLMSPGLHIDARDPANPKAQIIWPS